MNCKQCSPRGWKAVCLEPTSVLGQYMQQCCTNNWKLFCFVFLLFLFFFLTQEGFEDGFCMVPSVCCVLGGGLQYLGLL